MNKITYKTSKSRIIIKDIKIIMLIWKDDNKNKYFLKNIYDEINNIKHNKWLPIIFNKNISNRTP